MGLRAVLFDVDFTLARPGPELGPEGYVRAGERHGLRLDAARYPEARDAALLELKRHPELEHDDEIWFRFTERIVRGMGGEADSAYACAVEITRGWERHDNFDLYDDVLPALAAVRAAGLRVGLVSN
ncbi:MAG TPA: HAD family hydrolase, partial [Gaiellaceae bacterium]|nr:HAD family hydrolase [Gaiellaceae bacterium]